MDKDDSAQQNKIEALEKEVDRMHEILTMKERAIAILAQEKGETQERSTLKDRVDDAKEDATIDIIKNILTSRDTCVDSVTLLRRIRPLIGDGYLDMGVQVVAADETYAPFVGGLFTQKNSLSAYAIKTGQAQYGPYSDNFHTPAGVTDKASEYAIPYRGTREDRDTILGTVLLRRNSPDAFSKVDQTMINEALNKIDTQLRGFFSYLRHPFDNKANTILSAERGNEKLKDEYERAIRSREPYTIAFIDIDDFKDINTRFGHIEADKILFYLGEFFRQHTRPDDVVFRYGGDEYMIGMKTDVDASTEVLRRMHKRTADGIADNMDYLFNALGLNREMKVNFTTGGVCYDPIIHKTPPSYSALRNQADHIMLTKKKKKKSGIDVKNWQSD